MKGTDIREIISEEKQVQRHKEALDSLVHMRSKLLRESLEERIRRPQDHGGVWVHQDSTGIRLCTSTPSAACGINFL